MPSNNQYENNLPRRSPRVQRHVLARPAGADHPEHLGHVGGGRTGAAHTSVEVHQCSGAVLEDGRASRDQSAHEFFGRSRSSRPLDSAANATTSTMSHRSPWPTVRGVHVRFRAERVSPPLDQLPSQRLDPVVQREVRLDAYANGERQVESGSRRAMPYGPLEPPQTPPTDGANRARPPADPGAPSSLGAGGTQPTLRPSRWRSRWRSRST
jgi:hypothetical protein